MLCKYFGTDAIGLLFVNGYHPLHGMTEAVISTTAS